MSEFGDPCPDDQIEHVFVVENECHGWRLDRFLQKRIPRLSRERVQRVIRGDCWLDGLKARPGQTVRPGQSVLFRRPAPTEPDVPRTIPLVYTDDSFYVIDKPAGLPMHPTAKWHKSTLTNVLREVFPNEHLQIAHRIDLETSGLLLVARTAQATSACKRAFARRLVKKKYVAIVNGQPPDETVIDAPLALGGGAVRVKMWVRPEGLPSVTRVRTVERRGPFALVECEPITGRQHQIRAHLDHIGCPIVGDKLYPDETIFADFQDHGWEAIEGRVPLARQALHAAWLQFPHPVSGEPVDVSVAMADDMQTFWDAQRAT